MKNLKPMAQTASVPDDTKALKTYTGVCVGGEDDGHVVSCSHPYRTHLSPNYEGYVAYVWDARLGAWLPADATEKVTARLLTSAYALLKGDDLKSLEDHVEARLRARIRRYPKASIPALVRQTGLTKYRVKKARREIREQDGQ